MGDFSISRLFADLKYKRKQRAFGSILSQVSTWTVEMEKNLQQNLNKLIFLNYFSFGKYFYLWKYFKNRAKSVFVCACLGEEKDFPTLEY